MSGWKKVRNLFWVAPGGPAHNPSPEDAPWALPGEAETGRKGSSPEGVPAGGDELSDDEFTQLLMGSQHAVPPGQAESVPGPQVPLMAPGIGSSASIDFQEQYNLAGIPDTDEVEQLEAFLGRLDASLPQTSKVAAAEAFLGAVGKDKAAVLMDAERKILRVRGLLAAHQAETEQSIQREQSEIDALTQRIEEHRLRMEEFNRTLESMRRACLSEESRLQAARVFFGNVAKG